MVVDFSRSNITSNNWTSYPTSHDYTGAAVGYPERVDSSGNKYRAERVEEDTSKLKRAAQWVGGRPYEGTGIRVPTLEGVEVAFIGDWIVKDKDGIVYIYTDEDFKRDFRTRLPELA